MAAACARHEVADAVVVVVAFGPHAPALLLRSSLLNSQIRNQNLLVLQHLPLEVFNAVVLIRFLPDGPGLAGRSWPLFPSNAFTMVIKQQATLGPLTPDVRF